MIFFCIVSLRVCSVMLIRFFFLFSLQQRAKENREARKRMITDEYRFIMGIVGGYLDLEVSAIEEFIVDSEEVFEFSKPYRLE